MLSAETAVASARNYFFWFLESREFDFDPLAMAAAMQRHWSLLERHRVHLASNAFEVQRAAKARTW